MLIHWLQRILFGAAPTGEVGRGPTHAGTAAKPDQKLLDVVREAMREEATDLGDLVAKGFPAIRRRRSRQRVRRKVRTAISPAFAAPEVVEEITERLANAAEVDPYYARLFAEDDTK